MVQIFQSVYSPHDVILRREGSGVSDLTFEKNKTELLAVRTLLVYISVKFCFRILKLFILPDATHKSIKSCHILRLKVCKVCQSSRHFRTRKVQHEQRVPACQHCKKDCAQFFGHCWTKNSWRKPVQALIFTAPQGPEKQCHEIWGSKQEKTLWLPRKAAKVANGGEATSS